MRVFPWLLVLVLAAFIFFMLQADLQVDNVEVPEVVEIDNGPNLIIEKVTDLGNLELVQYDFKDVVEYKVRKNKLLPDDQYLIVVAGEATACIDSTRYFSGRYTIICYRRYCLCTGTTTRKFAIPS